MFNMKGAKMANEQTEKRSLNVDQQTILNKVIEMIEWMEPSGAACAQLIIRGKDDVALGGVIILNGVPETQEIIDAVTLIEAQWESEDQENVNDK